MIKLFFILFFIVAPASGQVSICFTPQENCTKEIVQLIHSAKHTINMQGYTFTSVPIARALIAAQYRGVIVHVILDKTQFDCHHFSERLFLLRAHVPVWEDDRLNIAHNKVIIIDHKVVETGSFNFTHMAQFHNAENVVLIPSARIAAMYEKNWMLRRRQSHRVLRFKC